eukprot:6479575-Amphidinium_carterae.1
MYREEQEQLDDKLWQQVEEGYGSLVQNKKYMEAWHDKDFNKIWTKMQIERDLKKNEVKLAKAQQREEERQQVKKRKRDEEAQAVKAKARPTVAPEVQSAAASAKSSTEPPKPTRAVPISQRDQEAERLEDSLKEKGN